MIKKNRGLMVLLIGVFLSLAAPSLLTHCNLSDWFDLSKDEYANIGSTLGGITAPIVGLVGAYLLYLALMESKKANDLKNIHSNINWVRDTISKNNILKYDQVVENLLSKSEMPVGDHPLRIYSDEHFDNILQIAQILNETVKEVDKEHSHYLKKTIIYLVENIKDCQVFRVVDKSSICLMDGSGNQFFPSNYINEAWTICESWKLKKDQKI